MSFRNMLLLSGSALLLVACSAMPGVNQPVPAKGEGPSGETGEQSAPLPASQAAVRSPAVAALLTKARSERREGQPERARISLERALRIEARDPEVWLELAYAAFESDEFEASVEFANRAGRLAGPDEALRRNAEKLERAARLKAR